MALIAALLLIFAPAASAFADPGSADSDSADPGSADSSSDSSAEVPLSVTMTSMTPAVLRPGEDWTIRGTVTNNTDGKLRAPLISLRLQTYVPSTRSALSAWTLSGTSQGSVVFTAQRLKKDLAPGQTRKFQIKIPGDRSPFSSRTEWGPHGIEVTAASDSVSSSARTFALWYPDGLDLDAPTELSLIAPLTATDEEWSQAVNDSTTVAEAVAPRLGPVLDELANTDISWALDPALLETTRLGATIGVEEAGGGQPAGDDAGADSGSASGSADETTAERSAGAKTDGAKQDHSKQPKTKSSNENQTQGAPSSAEGGETKDATAYTASDLRQLLTSRSKGRDTVAMSYAFADPAALAEDPSGHLAQALRGRGADLLEQNDISTLRDVSWPARSDLNTLDSLAEAGIRSVIIPARAQQPTSDLTYTPSGRSRIATDSGDVETALWDQGLSALFDSDQSPLQIRQSMLAQTAVIARERPQDPRSLLAALPEDFGSDANQMAALKQTVNAAKDAAPWLRVTNLRSLLGRPDPSVDRAPLPKSATSTPSLTENQVSQLAKAWDSAAAFGQITATPERFLGPVETNIFSAFATKLAHSATEQNTLISASSDSVSLLEGALSVETGSSINLISSGGQIPIAVKSELKVPVTLTVKLVPEDPRLRADEAQTLQIKPESEATARIPVTAVSNGDVKVFAQVRSSDDGAVLATGEPFSVRVRADWESTGTAVIAALLVAGFLIGLIRTIKRGRRAPEHARSHKHHLIGHSGPKPEPEAGKSTDKTEPKNPGDAS